MGGIMTLHSIRQSIQLLVLLTLSTSYTTSQSEDTTRDALHHVLASSLCFYDILHEMPRYTTPLMQDLDRIAQERVRTFTPMDMREWALFVNIAADNDLFRFALRNIEQLKQVGSSQKLHIFVRFDYHQPGRPKETRYLYIEKNKVIQIGDTLSHDSGDADALISFVQLGLSLCPSKYVALDLWNHGSGDLNPFMRNGLNPAELFSYNPESQMVELRRDIPYLALLEALHPHTHDRGICFDETTGNYLDDAKLTQAFRAIYEARGNKPIDVLLLDACMGAGIGMAYLAAPYARYMTASEEVVLGPGYNYTLMLDRVARESLEPKDFARHIVSCYQLTYNRITRDYTESALALAEYELLHACVDELGKVLADALKYDQSKAVRIALSWCRSSERCTSFQERSYIDLGHFYKNLITACNDPLLLGSEAHADLSKTIKSLSHEGLMALNTLVIANVTGENLKHATGLYIYLPEDGLHGSYPHTAFAQDSGWFTFLKEYFRTHRQDHTFVEQVFDHHGIFRTA